MTVSRVSLGDVSFNQTYHTHDLGDNNQKGSRDHHGHHTFICSKYFMFPRLSAGIHSCTMFNDSGQPYPKWDFPRCLRTPLEKSFPFKVHSGICKLPHEKYGNTMLSQHPWECDRIHVVMVMGASPPLKTATFALPRTRQEWLAAAISRGECRSGQEN